jgi:CHAT domain-containing protein
MSRFKLCLAWVVVLAFSVLASSSASRRSFAADSFPLQSADEFVAKLLAAKTDEERTSLLETNKQLVNRALCDELIKRVMPPIPRNKRAEALIASNLLLQLSEKLGYDKGKIEALRSIALEHRERGERQLALKMSQQALALAETAGETALINSLHSNLCIIWQELGDLDQATKHCQISLQMAEARGAKSNIASVNLSLGAIAFRRSDNEKAVEYFQKSALQFQALGNQQYELNSLQNVGNSYYRMGHFTAALQAYARVLPLAEALGDELIYARILARISSIHLELGNSKLALETAQRSLVINEKLGIKAAMGSALTMISYIYRRANELERSLEYALKGLALAEESKDRFSTIESLISIAASHLRLGNLKEAGDYYQRALSMAEPARQTDAVPNCLIGLSQVYLLQDKPAEALEYAERSILSNRQFGNQGYLWLSLQYAGRALAALKKYEPARARFEEAIRVLESLRGDLAASEVVTASYLSSRVEPYQHMAKLLLSQGKTAEAFHFAERSKARVLLDTLKAGKADLTKAMSLAERQQEIKVRDALAAANSKLTRATQSGQTEPAQLAELKAAQEKARLAYETFEANLYAAHPELKVQRGEAQPIKVEELAALLPSADTALLEYLVTEDVTYLFTLTKAAHGVELKAFPIALKRAELAKLADTFRRQLAARDFEYRASGRKLYDLLLAPAHAQLRGKAQLVVVPDNTLWELPFQALLTGANRHLIEDAAVSYAPSLTALRGMMARRKTSAATPRGLLALGNPALEDQIQAASVLVLRDDKLAPLPEAEREAKALGALYGATQSQVLIGAAAREDRFKAEAAKYDVLHFAAHGILNDASPLYSHLALSSGGADDGLLEAWEILKLDLRADLVVLSACETARGCFGAGEGIIGLSWAFFIAGAPTTVVSQWQVSSASTAQLMIEFHRQLKPALTQQKAELTRAGAMRAAALKLLAAKETRHPFYWAGFVVIGAGY